MASLLYPCWKILCSQQTHMANQRSHIKIMIRLYRQNVNELGPKYIKICYLVHYTCLWNQCLYLPLYLVAHKQGMGRQGQCKGAAKRSPLLPTPQSLPPFSWKWGLTVLKFPWRGKGIRHTSRWSINKILEKSLNACGFISFKKVSPSLEGY